MFNYSRHIFPDYTNFSSHTCGNPILSWTKVIDKAKIWPSRFPCHSFSFLLPPPGMTPGSVAPRTVHSVRPGSTTTWPTCRDVTLSHNTFLISFQRFLVTLQALFAKVTKLFTKTNLTCNATATQHHMQLSRLHLFLLTLTTLVRNSIAYAHDCQNCLIQCWVQRYFIHPMLCGTVQVSVLALHRIDAATPFPNPWDCPSTSWWYPSCFG